MKAYPVVAKSYYINNKMQYLLRKIFPNEPGIWIIFLEISGDGSSNNASTSQVIDVKMEAATDLNNDKLPESKTPTDANEENALIKKIGKKIRLRKKKKREAKKKKTENRAKKALKTIR